MKQFCAVCSVGLIEKYIVELKAFPVLILSVYFRSSIMIAYLFAFFQDSSLYYVWLS